MNTTIRHHLSLNDVRVKVLDTIRAMMAD